VPKEDNKRIQAEADLLAEFYTGLNKKGRDFVMLAVSQVNDASYKRPPRPIKEETKPLFAAAGRVQTAPERLSVANEDLAISRTTGGWMLNRRVMSRTNLVVISDFEADHILPMRLLNVPKFGA
jgi:hypothetical protein